MPAMAAIRQCAVAGTWYPRQPQQLAAVVDAQLAAVATPAAGRPRDRPSAASSGAIRRRPRALISPHAGLVYSGPVAAHAYALIADLQHSAIVLVGPSHFVAFAGVSIWDRGQWETPFGPLPIEESLAGSIRAETAGVIEHAAAHTREHSLEMQLPFLARLEPGVPIVPLVMGRQTRATAEQLGDGLAAAIGRWSREGDTRQVLLVASSDLSHFHPADEAAALDGTVAHCIERFDPEALMDALEGEPGHACGGGPMVAVLRAARTLGGTEAQVLRYADSGDVTGDKTSVVGYLAAAIW